MATNNELHAELSEDLIPVLEGQTRYRPDKVSQFEQTVMDCAFRVALLKVIGQMTNSTPSLVLDTLDEVTDQAYAPYLADALSDSAQSMSIITTTVNSVIMERLLKRYTPEERKERTFELISRGNLTQRKHYQQKLNDYLSGKR
jgi:recombinational DNA repair ATPase RecF